MNLSQSQIKLVRSLGQKKFRQKYQYFVAEGSKICIDALRSSYDVVQIFALAEWLTDYNTDLQHFDDRIIQITPKQLKQISFLKTPNKVLMVLRIPQDSKNVIDITKGLHFYLDGIQNPGNLGTIIRIADWFGFASVIASSDCVDFYNEKTIQATMGAFTNMELVKSNLTDLDNHSIANIMTTALDGDSIYEIALPKDAIIVIGNEGSGISEDIISISSLSISIPAHQTSTSDSLNASVSAGIIASLFRRPSTNI